MKFGFIALAGRPNAGKSTLLNALMHQKLAIVSEKPQTTRSQIRGIMSLHDCQMVFTDTPGIHKPHTRLESRMNKEASGVIFGTDLIYLVIDGSVPWGSGDAFVLKEVQSANVPVFLILNKIDTMTREQILVNLQSWQKRFDFAEFFALSAANDTDFTDLLETTEKYLPEGEFQYPVQMTSDEPEDFRIAEIIREKILQCTEEEVPHACAVYVESRNMKEDRCEIQAVILVERDGQKGILIGKQGSMLKKITEISRREIEKMLNLKTDLNLFVRVEENWRDRDSRITECGYGGQSDQ